MVIESATSILGQLVFMQFKGESLRLELSFPLRLEVTGVGGGGRTPQSLTEKKINGLYRPRGQLKGSLFFFMVGVLTIKFIYGLLVLK